VAGVGRRIDGVSLGDGWRGGLGLFAAQCEQPADGCREIRQRRTGPAHEPFLEPAVLNVPEAVIAGGLSDRTLSTT